MADRRASRIAAVLLSVGTLVVIAVTFIVWSEMRTLPQAIERAPRVQKPRIAINTSPSTLSQQARPLAAGEPTDIQSSPPTLVPQNQQTAIYDYLASRFSNPSTATVNVCDNLTRVRATSINDSASLISAMNAVAQGQNIGDPYVESVMGPMGFIYSRPAVQNLILQVQTGQASRDPNYASRPEFKSSLAMANSEIITNRGELQKIGQLSYHLFVLTRAIALNPNMGNDPAAMGLCQRLQSELQPGVPINIQAEQADLLRFLAYAGLSPQQVGYDPSISPDIIVQNTSRQIIVKFPWMEKVLKSEIGTSTPIRPATNSQP